VLAGLLLQFGGEELAAFLGCSGRRCHPPAQGEPAVLNLGGNPLATPFGDPRHRRGQPLEFIIDRLPPAAQVRHSVGQALGSAHQADDVF
jgi:hypothetical protein